MIKRIQINIWLLRYAVEFRRLTTWTLKESWNYGKCTLEDNSCDLDFLLDPKSMVLEDLSCWDD